MKPQDPISSLDSVLERFAGNRTYHLTTVDGGRLTAFRRGGTDRDRERMRNGCACGCCECERLVAHDARHRFDRAVFPLFGFGRGEEAIDPHVFVGGTQRELSDESLSLPEFAAAVQQMLAATAKSLGASTLSVPRFVRFKVGESA